MREIIKKWVRDLRENPDLKGIGSLYNSFYGTYCCLGRLLTVAGCKQTTENDGAFLIDGRRYTVLLPKSNVVCPNVNSFGGFYPEKLSEEAREHLKYLDGKYEFDYDTLAAINDAGATFAEIATLIEFIENDGAWCG